MAESSNSNTRTILIVGLAILLVGGMFAFFYNTNGKPSKRWYVMLRKDVKDPYGLYMIHKLLDEQFPEYRYKTMDEDIHLTLDKADDDTLSNYIFIGQRMFADSAAKFALRDFVARGNNAFIFAEEVPDYLLSRDSSWYQSNYYGQYNYNYYNDTTVLMNLRHPDLTDSVQYRFTFQFDKDSSDYTWYYFDPYFEPDTTIDLVEIGYMEGSVNFGRVPWGKGNFYFHTVPLVMTNHFLMKDRTRQYAESVLGHMAPGNIYYDNASQSPNYDFNRREGRGRMEESALSYILSQPALRWSMMLMLISLLLYVIFRAKRRQRIVPVLEPNTNSSLEFLQTIGRLYFLTNDHKKLASKKMRLFLSFIRGRYHISTQHIDDKLIDQIARKAKVPRDHVNEIFKKYKAIEYLDEVSDTLLIQFHETIDRFHQTCK